MNQHDRLRYTLNEIYQTFSFCDKIEIIQEHATKDKLRFWLSDFWKQIQWIAMNIMNHE